MAPVGLAIRGECFQAQASAQASAWLEGRVPPEGPGVLVPVGVLVRWRVDPVQVGVWAPSVPVQALAVCSGFRVGGSLHGCGVPVDLVAALIRGALFQAERRECERQVGVLERILVAVGCLSFPDDPGPSPWPMNGRAHWFACGWFQAFQGGAA